MRLRKKLLFCFSIAVVLIAILGLVSVLQLRGIARPLAGDVEASISRLSQTSHLDALAQFIRYYDEVLTQSARNYAFTQEPRWEIRYRYAEPILDRVIKEAVQKGDSTDQILFSGIDSANLALVDLESRALDLVNQGRADIAIKLLEGDIYWEYKSRYEQGLRDYVNRRGAKYDEALHISAQTAAAATEEIQGMVDSATWNISVIAGVFFILAIGSGVSAYRSVKRAFPSPANGLQRQAAEKSSVERSPL